MSIHKRLEDLGLTLPALPKMPPETVATFSWVRVVGVRILVSGHGAQSLDGSPMGLLHG
jgi:hypothetical protein